MRRFHFQRLKDKQSTFCVGKTLLIKKVVFNQLPWNNLYSERHSLLWKQKVTKWKWKFWIDHIRVYRLLGSLNAPPSPPPMNLPVPSNVFFLCSLYIIRKIKKSSSIFSPIWLFLMVHIRYWCCKKQSHFT